MKTVYMDYAATTYVKPEVLEEMMPYFTEKFGNPSSFYGISRETKMAIDKARGQVAKALNCDIDELSVSEVIDLIQENPRILKSPILIDDKRLQVGYKEDDIRAFLPRSIRNVENSQARMRAAL